jgi:cytochrome c biogenesis protein CcmG/thiol:disulfide interchange protein DsbE
VIRAVPASVVAGILLLGGCSSSTRPVKAASLKPEKDRKAAPEFALKDADGKTVKLSEYRGKVVLLNFWATWCGPCKIEIPWFMEFQQELKHRGFEVLGVAMDDEGWDIVKPYLEQRRVNYRNVVGTSAVADLYGGVESLPTTFKIDREGRVASVHIGLVSKSNYETDILQLLEAKRAGRADGIRGTPAFWLRAR